MDSRCQIPHETTRNPLASVYAWPLYKVVSGSELLYWVSPSLKEKLVISEAMSALLKLAGSGAAVVNEPDCDMAAVKLPHVPIVQLV